MAQYTVKSALKYIKAEDIFAIFKAMLVFPFAIIAKIFVRKFWLVCEEKNEARDNGYWFFKWVRENRPKQKIAYAINKKAVDYDRVKDLGKIISYGSIAHWFWYIVADKNISSQKGGKPNASVCYFFEVMLGFRKNNRVFLQHGVIKDKLTWLTYNNTKMRMFCTSSKDEYEYIKSEYGYPQGYVKLTGLCRFDNLHDTQVDNDLILVMPTWRNWLGRESTDNAHLDFSQTTYCKKWNEFLMSEKLAELLEKYDKKLIFFPHRNMQKFISSFSCNSNRIEIADGKKYGIQELLKRAALMITDYSSVFFDFAYMCKPVIFYQFDEQEFRERQYAEGYFDYHTTLLGQWCCELDEALKLLANQLENGFNKIPEDMIKSIFPYYDTNNCGRTYEAVRQISR